MDTRAFADRPLPPGPSTRHLTLFRDAAIHPDRERYVVGVYLPRGGIRSRVCPRWVHTLQCAELYTVLDTFQLAAYMGWNRAVSESESWVSRAQACVQRPARPTKGLAPFFLVPCLDIPVHDIFWVPTRLNPVDPPSRLSTFVSRKEALHAAHARYAAWRELGFCYPNLQNVPRFPWGS